MKTKILNFLAHYFFGLVTSCWNAGITAIKINGGVSLAADIAPQSLHAPDVRMILGVFGAAIFWEAIDYFKENPLPTKLPDEAATRAT